MADEIGNNHFGPYKQPYSPRHLNTMHVTEKLYVHAKPAIHCVLRLHGNVRSTISWHAATDFSVFTWRAACQQHSHIKEGLEFRVIKSLLKFSRTNQYFVCEPWAVICLFVFSGAENLVRWWMLCGSQRRRHPRPLLALGFPCCVRVFRQGYWAK